VWNQQACHGDRHVKILGRVGHGKPREIRSADADHHHGLPVHQDLAPHNRRVSAEFRFPDLVAQHHHLTRPPGGGVFGQNRAAERHGDTQHREVIAGNQQAAQAATIDAGEELLRGNRIGERRGAGPQRLVLVPREGRLSANALGAIGQLIQAVRIVHRGRPQDVRIEQGEQHCHLRHNVAVWQGYGLFELHSQHECPRLVRQLRSQWDPVDRSRFLNPSRLHRNGFLQCRFRSGNRLRAQVYTCRKVVAIAKLRREAICELWLSKRRRGASPRACIN